MNHEVDMGVLLLLGSPAQITEYSRRTNNLAAIRNRITANTAKTSLDLELLLKNQSPTALNGTVEMTVTGQTPKQQAYTIAARTNLLIKGSAKSNINFFVTLQNNDTVLHDVQITVPTPGSLHELRLDNNFVEFACYILNLTMPCDTTTDYIAAPPRSLFAPDKLSSPFRMVDKLNVGFLPGVDGQFLANKYKEVFGRFPEKIFVVGSRTLGNSFGDIDTIFVSDRVIDRDGIDRVKAWDLFKKVNPQLAGFISSNGITGIGQATPDNPNPRGLGYDPDDIPKAGTVDTIFATYYEMTRPGVLVWEP